MDKKTLPVMFPDILLPKKSIPLEKWAVVACDQFTSNREYWRELENFIAGSETALNVTFPEIYLASDNSARIKRINDTMRAYSKEIFDTYKECAVLVDRSTPFNPKRLGIVIAVDLEEYSFVPEDKALIRATEGTILERIPPRVEIRKNAYLELPHIMLLIDDETKSVIEPLFADDNELLYDFELNMNGGHIKGYKLKDKDRFLAALSELMNPDRIKEKYNGDRLLFAAGDGNHSLATAKTCWNSLKRTLSAEEIETHPARFALCEIVNIFDDGLKFEPIHRALFNVDAEAFVAAIHRAFSSYGGRGVIRTNDTDFEIPLPEHAIEAVEAVQNFSERWQKENQGVIIDYIHGDDEVKRIGGESNSLAVVLPKMSKEELFPYIVNKGVLPRKTFSMGEGQEKRYYIESRRIHK